jgi:hypothetical protein
LLHEVIFNHKWKVSILTSHNVQLYSPISLRKRERQRLHRSGDLASGAGFSQQRLGFSPRAVHVRFVVGKVAGRSGFQGSIPGRDCEFFASPPRPERLWGPTSLLSKGYQGIKRPGLVVDHPPPSSAEVKNAWSYSSTPPIRLHGVVFS